MTCNEFKEWTQKHYEDAYCAGCCYFLLFTDGNYDCQLGCALERRIVMSKVFGKAELVVKYNGRKNT